jgi:hypothetical protein
MFQRRERWWRVGSRRGATEPASASGTVIDAVLRA